MTRRIPIFELDEELILNEEYESHRGKYKLVGYNSKAKTYPLIMEDMETGRLFQTFFFNEV